MKDKKKLLTEELNRFRMLNEYSFYVPDGDDPKGEIDDLLLDNPMLKEEDPEEADADLAGLEGELDAETDVVDAEMEAEPTDDMGGEEPAMDEPAMDEPAMDEPETDLSVDEPEDEVELDVTELVASADEAKASADSANQKVDQLIGMVSKLESQLNNVNAIGAKIDNLENELEKRAPTPEEKIEMRSLDSYPYNLKLTDFWKTQEGKYNVMDTEEGEGTPEEYTLTSDDIDSDYSESQIKGSFDDSNNYEEEDIY